MTGPADRRWPRWVYADGDEPDARFSFANERTFLAWIRTSLALLAGGLAVDGLALGMPHPLREVLAVVLVALGTLCAVASWSRWARAERAMRRGEPLPPASVTGGLTVGVVVVAIVLLIGTR